MSILTVEDFVEGFQRQDKSYLAKAITYCESKKEAHRLVIRKLLSILPHKSSKRIGISGTPGVGKSTFLENFGSFLISKKETLAVLAVDPTSVVSGGSILGDKTRMEKLSQSDAAYIRPSPSRLNLGGVAEHTVETILLCEKFGFETIFVETVGVGQSEVEVSKMVDFFILLIAPLGGDELQGIKRGILEVSDLVIVNKADGENLTSAEIAKHQYESSVQVLQNKRGHKAKVLLCSSLKKSGFDEIENEINSYFKNCDIAKNRTKQNKMLIKTLLLKKFEESLEHSENQKKIETLLNNSKEYSDILNNLDSLFKKISGK